MAPIAYDIDLYVQVVPTVFHSVVALETMQFIPYSVLPVPTISNRDEVSNVHVYKHNDLKV